MTRTQVYLPSSKYEDLKRMATSRNQTFAAYLRELIDEGLKVVKKKGIKRGKSPDNAVAVLLASRAKIQKWKEKDGGIRDGSTNLDTYLYSREAIFGK